MSLVPIFLLYLPLAHQFVALCAALGHLILVPQTDWHAHRGILRTPRLCYHNLEFDSYYLEPLPFSLPFSGVHSELLVCPAETIYTYWPCREALWLDRKYISFPAKADSHHAGTVRDCHLRLVAVDC